MLTDPVWGQSTLRFGGDTKNHPGVCFTHQFGMADVVCELLGAARLSDQSDLSDLSDDGCAAKINHCGK